MHNIEHLSKFVFHNQSESMGGDYCDIESDTDAMGMRAMWRAVITQALMDAVSESKKAHSYAERARARAWLKGGNKEDFVKVCSLAELDPDYVKHQARLAILRRCKWRNDYKNK